MAHSEGRLSYEAYDDGVFIYLETMNGPTTFAEIRGYGAGLPQEANARRICELWNNSVEEPQHGNK